MTTTPPLKDNLELAASAREMADNIPAGTLDHAAAASVAITCATTRSIPQARHVLDGLTPDNVRRAAIDLFDQLARPNR